MGTFYPIMMNLQGKKAAIIGGGQIALRKAKGLANTGIQVIVISPDILKSLQQLPSVTWIKKEFEPADLKGMHLIFAATNVKQVNQLVCQSAADFQWVNDVSDSKNSSFITPAVVRRDDLVLSVSTSGSSPVFAKKIKQELEQLYDERISEQVKAYKNKRRRG